MGLFRRKADNKAELESVKSELRTMRERIDYADAVKSRLVEKLGQLHAENERLTAHVGDVETEVGTVMNHMVSVESSVDQAVSTAATADSVESLKGDVARLPEQLAELSTLLGRQQQQIADVAVVATDSAERAAASQSAVDDLATATESQPPTLDHELREQVAQLADKVSTMDARINQISVELTNQLTELSNDVDAAASRPADTDNDAIIEELERLMSERVDTQINDITDGQQRLANEQARYAIQFREDLAELAERLRRPAAR